MNCKRKIRNIIMTLLLVMMISCISGCAKKENAIVNEETTESVESIEQELETDIANETQEETQEEEANADREKEEANHATTVDDYEILKFVEKPIQKELIDWNNGEEELVHLTFMIRLNKEWKKETEIYNTVIGYRDPDSKHDVIDKVHKGDVKIYNMRSYLLDDVEELETMIYMFVVPEYMREQLQVGFKIPNTYFDVAIPEEISPIPDSVIGRGEYLWDDIARDEKKIVYFDQHAYVPYENSIYWGSRVQYDEIVGRTSGYMVFMPIDFTQGIDLNYNKLTVGISEVDKEEILNSDMYEYIDYNKMKNSIEVRCAADEDLQIGKHDIFSRAILVKGMYNLNDLNVTNSEDISSENFENSRCGMTLESCMYDYGNRLDIHVENGENSFSIINGYSDEVRVRRERQ